MRRIGIVTTSRADYGIYRPILLALRKRRAKFELYVTGTHLHKEFGLTVRAIEQDGFPIAARIKTRLGSMPGDTSRAMGETMSKFAGVLDSCRPDILVVLGDRFEMHAMATAAVPFGIPIAHIHGGELTFGAIDDMFRHSLTKLSSLHFAATRQYVRRICQMGEDPSHVILSGAPGLGTGDQDPELTKEELARLFQIKFDRNVFLVTFHPVTQEARLTGVYVGQLLKALAMFSDAFIVFTGVNADPGYDQIKAQVKSFIRKHKNAVLVRDLGSRGYLSMLTHARVMVGNSSSGIIEAPSYKLPVVNIGTRQDGRVRAVNVIDVGYQAEDICRGIKRGLSAPFIKRLRNMTNPYYIPDAPGTVAKVLCEIDLNSLNVKKFKDIIYAAHS